MCVIVNADLIIPAVVASEFSTMRRLNIDNTYSDIYLEAMTISVSKVMNYAKRMKSWDLGRVVITFNSEDIDFYLRSNTEFFRELEGSEGIYSIKIPKDGEIKKENSVRNLLKKLTATINYSPRVLKTVGLLQSVT